LLFRQRINYWHNDSPIAKILFTPNAKSLQLEKLGEGKFRDRNEVIPDIPICTGNIPNVVTKANNQPD
jgi:hypothetical protein